MTKNQMEHLVDLFDMVDKDKLKSSFTKDDFLLLCETFQERVKYWQNRTESADNRLELLLGMNKLTKEIEAMSLRCNHSL